jgi:hypothetical protein
LSDEFIIRNAFQVGQQKKAYWLTHCCSINIIERECKFYIQLKIQR